jgi:DNA-directed primase/polymerase protein
MMSDLTTEDDLEIESTKDGKTTSELVTLEDSIKLNYFYKMAMFPTQALCFTYHDQRMQECKPKVNSLTGEDGCCKEISLLMSMEPRLFAIEHFREGKRRYISCHLGRFLKYYLEECNSSTRHAYELIRENTPCRLYLDLEFRRDANVEISSKMEEQLMTELIEELSIEFQNVYNIDMKSHHVIDLESSTDDKFSRHLIIHLPNGALFPDAISCGSFVKNFVGRLAEGAANGSLECDRPILAKHLFVFDKKIDVKEKGDYNDERKKVCFIDLGVYTRNRIFRILGSSKYGKDPNTSVLRIARTNSYPIPKSLYNIDFSCIKKLKDMSEFLVDTLVVPIESQRDNVPLLHNVRTTDVLNNKRMQRISKSGPNTKQFTVKLGPSPFFELDKFVTTHLATRYGLNGSIRSWSQEGDGSMNSIVTYQIRDNRWCENIQRPHKSNNVMWHVSISDMEYWQG